MANAVNLDFHLHPAQMKVFQSPARFNIVAAGRRFGKSDLAAKRSIVKALSPQNVRGMPVWIVGPTQQQTREIYWNALMRLSSPVRKSHHVNNGTITLQNDVEIGLKGSDRPDTMRGSGLFDVTADEIADMKPVTWEEILRPTLSDVKGTALMIGTPKGRNHFYQWYTDALNDETGEWAAFHFTTLDNPFIDPDEIEAARRTLSASAFRQEYLASFETGSSDTFKAEWLKWVADDGPRKGEKNMPDEQGDWVVPVDLAGFADVQKASNVRLRRLDQTVIPVIWIGESGRRWVKRIEMGRWGVKETAKRIVDVIEKEQPKLQGIEKGALYNAVMPYIQDELHRRKMSVRFEELSHNNKSKVDRIVWALQGRMEHGLYTFAPGEWQREVEDQFLHFPSKLVHDDVLDAIAYGEQLAEKLTFANFGHEINEPYWAPMDREVGF